MPNNLSRRRLISMTISTTYRSEGAQMQSTARQVDHHSTKPDPLEVFRARAEARATLVAHGLHSLQDTVDTLQAAAEAQGLVRRYGQDAVQEILSEAFARWL